MALADRVGVSRSNLYRIEHGLVIPSIETVLKLAKVLRVPLEGKLADYCSKLINRRYAFKKRYLIRNLIKKNKSPPDIDNNVAFKHQKIR